MKTSTALKGLILFSFASLASEKAERVFQNEPTPAEIGQEMRMRDRLELSDDSVDRDLPPGRGLSIEVYLGSSQIDKQFGMASVDGELRQVFAVSSGRDGHETPTGANMTVRRMLREHNSTSYPSRVGNNMDFAIYFRDAYALHATLPDAYSDLGTPASHGCIRMVRPSANELFDLTNEIGRNNTRIWVYGVGANPPSTLLDQIREKLGENFDLIHRLIEE